MDAGFEHQDRATNDSPPAYEKKPYTPPRLTVYGDVHQLTSGAPKSTGTPDGSGFSGPPITSDRNLKEHVSSVDVQAVLRSLASLTLRTWSDQGTDRSGRHISPKAQDFAAAFGVGKDGQQIHRVDAAGVSFAAIQGLYQVVQLQTDELRALQAEIEAMNAGGLIPESP